jgi:hypothetical protein
MQVLENTLKKIILEKAFAPIWRMFGKKDTNGVWQLFAKNKPLRY